ncbi:MAG: tetratricopeptide repeat protein, partial [Myxococcales bacterium]|nr:tetratricopeptide repeat protein [Myxococcales bacterium]
MTLAWGVRVRAVTAICLLAGGVSVFGLHGFAAAQGDAPDGPTVAGDAVLRGYLDALAKKRLLAAETGSLPALKKLVQAGERLYLDGRHDAAALVLFEVAESPRFRDFADETEFRGAEYMLARSLTKLGALETAMRYLERVLRRGEKDPYFGPAYRAFVDVALERGRLDDAAERLAALGPTPLPEDAANELHYLRGRAHFDAGRGESAAKEFAAITKTNRFYANGQYLRGVMAARDGDLKRAEGHFCAIAAEGKNNTYSFYVDQRYFEVKDLAQLALGRVAHEGGRSEDAFYYYFQVPQDSERVAEAMFESAYAMYEGGDYETAVDLLDQLEARFPESAFVDEAKLLRGYIHLGRCEFEKADKLFVGFHRRFQPVLDEVDRILESPARQEGLFETLLVEAQYDAERRAKGEKGDASAPSTLLAMLRVDPEFYALHADVRTLDAEAARAGRLAVELGALAARVDGKDAPKPAAKDEQVAWDEAAELRGDLESARAVVRSLGEQLDAMRRSKASPGEIRELDVALVELGGRLAKLERAVGRKAGEAFADADVAAVDATGDGASGGDLTAL